jgi:hypothetical protein
MLLSKWTLTRDDMCQKLKKGQIIKTLTLKQKVKRYFMKWGDYILEGSKQ